MATKRKTTKVTKMYAHLVVDASGSMGSIGVPEIENSINGWVAGLNDDKEIDVTISITLFDSSNGIRRVRECVRSSRALLEKGEFVLGGMTPLYDAVGQTINFIDNDVVLEKGEKVSLTILTDGGENTSREFTREQVAKMVSSKQKGHNKWFVTYLGANQDGWGVGSSLGVHGIYAASYTMDNMAETIRGAAQKSALFATGHIAAATYNEADRTAMSGDAVQAKQDMDRTAADEKVKKA